MHHAHSYLYLNICVCDELAAFISRNKDHIRLHKLSIKERCYCEDKYKGEWTIILADQTGKKNMSWLMTTKKNKFKEVTTSYGNSVLKFCSDFYVCLPFLWYNALTFTLLVMELGKCSLCNNMQKDTKKLHTFPIKITALHH